MIAEKYLLDSTPYWWHSGGVVYPFKQALMLFGAVMLLAACGSEQTITKSQVRKDPWGNPERYGIGKDDDGNPVMKSDRRSSFEGKSSHIASGRDFRGKDYSTKSYSKKRWRGKTEYQSKKYEGNTDANHYKMEPWFVQKQAGSSDKQSDAQGKAYKVNGYGKSTAREQGGARLERVSDAETDIRRRVYKEPDIINWKDQQSLSVKDTNQLLGR